MSDEKMDRELRPSERLRVARIAAGDSGDVTLSAAAADDILDELRDVARLRSAAGLAVKTQSSDVVHVTMIDGGNSAWSSVLREDDALNARPSRPVVFLIGAVFGALLTLALVWFWS